MDISKTASEVIQLRADQGSSSSKSDSQANPKQTAYNLLEMLEALATSTEPGYTARHNRVLVTADT